MKRLLFIVFILLAIFFAGSTVLAATSSPSATQEEIDKETENLNETINENLNTRLKNINIGSTAAQLAEKADQLRLVGYTGNITAISTETLTFKNNGDIFQVITTEDTTYNKSNQVAKFTSLAIGDKAIIIGLLPKVDILEAKRIVVVKDIPPELPQVIFGTVTTVNTRTRVITIQSGETEMEMIISRNANLTAADFEVGKKAVVVIRDQNGDNVVTQGKVF